MAENFKRMQKEVYRVAADVETELIFDLDEMLAKHNLFLRGSKGVAKVVYSELMTDKINEVLADKKLCKKLVSSIIKKTGKGVNNFLNK